MPYHIKCCIAHCDNSSKIRHCFPNPKKDMKRYKQWLDVITNDKLSVMEPESVYKTKRICHKHFASSCSSTTSNRLHINAVPSMYLHEDGAGDLISNRDVPVTSATCPLTNFLADHNYSKITDYQAIPCPENENIVEVVKVAGTSNRTPLQLLKNSGISKQNITPRKRKLYSSMKQIYKRYTKERSSKNSFKRRLFEAEQFKKKHQLEVNTEKLNAMATILIRCQIRESGRVKKLRRFTLNEKLLALTLFKQGAKSYSVLSKIFILPSKSTLNRLLAQVVGGPGIHEIVFESLQERVEKMTTSDKYVAILFDEMSIMPGLHFNEQSGLLEGFEDMGENIRDSNIADHILLFMVRGLKKPWKSPISYHFAGRGGAKTLQIKNLLVKIIQQLMKIDLKPVTVICDQYNKAVINSLIQDTKEKYVRSGREDKYTTGSFEINNFKIFALMDPPHLIKGMRNNLIKKDLLFVKNFAQKTAKWEHIQRAYESDNGPIEGLKVLPHITHQHIYEKKMKKMKVKNAVQIFSSRFASTLQLISKIDTEKIIGDNVQDTAELLYFFDRLFDSLNGSNKHPDKGKTLRCGLTDTSEHLEFWSKEALPLLETMQFKKRKLKDQARPPSLSNWSFTIKNVKCIWQILKTEGFDYLLPRRLNQDPIENAFGQLRSFGALNTNPSVSQFIGVFKTLFCNNTLSFYKHSFNCEDDECENMFVSMKKLFIKDKPNHENIDTIKYSKASFESVETSLSQKLNELSTNYVAGFILKKIKKIVSCTVCKNSMFSGNYISDPNAFISVREYGGSCARRLCYPTPSFTSCFYDIFKIINFCLNQQPHSRFLVFQIEENVKSNVNFEFLSCHLEQHQANVIKLILKFTVRTLLHNWCKTVNRIIQGKSKSYMGSNAIKIEANKIRLNRIKRKQSKEADHTLSG